jgi:hypothetical protein
MRLTRAVFAGLFALVTAGSLKADTVTYAFQGGGQFSSWSFQYTAPGFITSQQTIPDASLDSCFTSGSCVSISFMPNVPDPSTMTANDEILFTLLLPSVGLEQGAFFFPSATFATPGTHNGISQYLEGPRPFDTLTVSEVSQVPEPATILLVTSGLMAGALRRRKITRR